MKKARYFYELEVYKLCRQLCKELFQLSKSFPREETYSLTDQMRRASRSIGAQIAEAWGKRKYERHFVSKLTDGLGEQLETQHWIETALDCSYISVEVSKDLISRYIVVGDMITSMIDKSSWFCE